MPFQKGQSGNPAGKPKGALRKATAKREAEIRASGLTPLAHMIAVLQDENSSKEDRRWAAQAAAPYVHPRLSSIDAKVQQEERHIVDTVDLSALSWEEREYLREIAKMLIAKKAATG
jgi:hypothetical protein